MPTPYLPPTPEVYYDKNGQRIYEHDLLKIFHFYGRRCGKGHKKYYMYKHVTIKNNHLFALHMDGSGEGYYLKSEACGKTDGATLGRVEVLQSPIRLKIELDLLEAPTPNQQKEGGES